MEVRDRGWVQRRVFVILMAGGLVGVMSVLPYTSTLLAPLVASGSEMGLPLWVLVSLQAVQSLVLVGGATLLGLWLGPKVGLGAPSLEAIVAGKPQARVRLRANHVLAAVTGLIVGAAIVGLDLWVFSPRLAVPDGPSSAVQPPVWQGLLASLYGGISEELMLRLGVMTLLVWLGTRISRRDAPTPAVGWTAIVVTALLFGIAHLPATAAVWPLTPLVVTRALLLNGLGGLVFGRLYWKHGVLAAMLAHLSTDLVLHVATPLLNS